MGENEKTMSRQKLEEQIIKRAQSDRDFKKTLLDKPKETLRQLGVQVPEEAEVKVVQESANMVYLVLPVNPDELTDEQLHAVCGGFFSCPVDCGFVYGILCHREFIFN
ncbi:MAG: NHLP leader peptide family RiPP precursor [Firmicutes bacterium]|nr:NHLP leader peptide family RiPP precursor [Bacillota bacterium]